MNEGVIYLILTSGFAYGGSIFLALKFDNFHDFFTEYIPPDLRGAAAGGEGGSLDSAKRNRIRTWGVRLNGR
jgi:hypothetical protein